MEFIPIFLYRENEKVFMLWCNRQVMLSPEWIDQNSFIISVNEFLVTYSRVMNGQEEDFIPTLFEDGEDYV